MPKLQCRKNFLFCKKIIFPFFSAAAVQGSIDFLKILNNAGYYSCSYQADLFSLEHRCQVLIFEHFLQQQLKTSVTNLARIFASQSTKFKIFYF